MTKTTKVSKKISYEMGKLKLKPQTNISKGKILRNNYTRLQVLRRLRRSGRPAGGAVDLLDGLLLRGFAEHLFVFREHAVQVRLASVDVSLRAHLVRGMAYCSRFARGSRIHEKLLLLVFQNWFSGFLVNAGIRLAGNRQTKGRRFLQGGRLGTLVVSENCI